MERAIGLNLERGRLVSIWNAVVIFFGVFLLVFFLLVSFWLVFSSSGCFFVGGCFLLVSFCWCFFSCVFFVGGVFLLVAVFVGVVLLVVFFVGVFLFWWFFSVGAFSSSCILFFWCVFFLRCFILTFCKHKEVVSPCPCLPCRARWRNTCACCVPCPCY